MLDTITFASVEAAKSRIANHVRHTPLEKSRWLSSHSEVLLKLECFQITGSFKIRGAMAKLSALTADEMSRGILTVSAGNHGLAVAHSAETLGLQATIIVPETASRAKIRAIERYGVNLIKRGKSYDEAERAARKMERETAMVFVSPYNDPEVIAGQGTAGIEVMEDFPEVDAIIVPVSGGGLLAGVAIAAKALSPDVKIYGVEPLATPTMRRALDEGRIIEIEEATTIADGLAGNIESGSITFPIIQELVEDIIVVDEQSIRRSIADVALNDHIIIEGSAATAVAAIGNRRLRGLRVAAFITGRNISLDVFIDAIGAVGALQ